MKFDLLTLSLAIFVTLVFVAVAAWIFSLVFNTSRQVKENRKQTLLLIKMSEKLGVSQDDIEGIINTTDSPK